MRRGDDALRHPQAPFNRQSLSALGVLTACLVFLFLLFFIIFAESLSDDGDAVPQADAIVVFTGTANTRIEAGLALLQAKKGQRLLITGLYENQNFDTVLALLPSNQKTGQRASQKASQQTGRDAAMPPRHVSCCIDLDYKASNTVENTRETALWADVHGFRSLIVVTSAHHMPRAFLELRRAMPTARLSAYPVVPPQVKLDYWFAYPGTMALLLGEYARYLWALTGLPRSS